MICQLGVGDQCYRAKEICSCCGLTLTSPRPCNGVYGCTFFKDKREVGE